MIAMISHPSSPAVFSVRSETSSVLASSVKADEFIFPLCKISHFAILGQFLIEGDYHLMSDFCAYPRTEYSEDWPYMTFQIGMVGVDGIVIASDRLGRYVSKSFAHELSQFATDTKYFISLNESLICFAAGGPSAIEAARKITQQCEPIASVPEKIWMERIEQAANHCKRSVLSPQIKAAAIALEADLLAQQRRREEKLKLEIANARPV